MKRKAELLQSFGTLVSFLVEGKPCFMERCAAHP